MFKKLSVAVIAAALLVSGALVGVGYAGGGGSTERTALAEPTVIELMWHAGGKDSNIHFYFLLEDKPGGRLDAEGRQTGQATTKRLPLFDVDGNRVGRQHIDCMASIDTGWICTLVSILRDTATTDKGTVVATGFSKHRPGTPNISTLPVTGGTGAYNNVGGHVVQEGVDGTVEYTLFLVPG